MKRFDEFKAGDKFRATCTTTEKDLDRYLKFARIKNAFLEEEEKEEKRTDKFIIPGRALLAKIEGEFTRLEEVYGNHIVLLGSDGDPDWGGRNTRFLTPFYTGDRLMITYVVSHVADVDDEYGRIAVDYEASDENGNLVLLSKRNIYRMKKNYKCSGPTRQQA